MPVFVASCPVSRLVRLGQHTLVGTIALVNVPWFMSRRCTCGMPASVPTGWSSVRMSTTSQALEVVRFLVLMRLAIWLAPTEEPISATRTPSSTAVIRRTAAV